MADTRQQVINFIRTQITDPLNQQNTALVVRNVLEYLVANGFNLADDELTMAQVEGLTAELARIAALIQSPELPEGISWDVEPVVTLSGANNEVVNVSESILNRNGEPEQYAAKQFTAVLPTSPNLRQDAVVAVEGGLFALISGDEGLTVTRPILAEGNLWVADVLFTSEGGKVTGKPLTKVDSALSTTSRNPVENRVITNKINEILSLLSPSTPDGMSLKNDIAVSINPSGEIVAGAGILVVNGVEHPFIAVNFGVPELPAAGFYRVHSIVAAYTDANGAFLQKVAQTTDRQHIVRPALGVGQLWIRDIILTHTGAIVGDASYLTEFKAAQTYVPKSETVPQTLQDAATVTLDGNISTNGNLTGTALLSTLSFINTIPGKDYLISITGASAKTINLAAVSGLTFKTLDGETVTSIDLPATDCQVLCYHESATVRRISVVDGKVGSESGNIPDGAATTGEAFSTILSFTNIFGHYRQSHTQTGAVTFTLSPSGNVAGTTIIQPFQANGVNAVNWDFVHRSATTSGTVLAAGDYDIYFNYEAAQVRVSVVAVSTGGGQTTLNAPGSFTATPTSTTAINLTWTDTNN